MILDAVTSSRGIAEGKKVVEKQRRIYDYLEKSNGLFEGRSSALERLERIKEDCSVSGWDGEDAKEVSLLSYNNARHWLQKAPAGIGAPDPGVNVRGQMTLEWRQRDGRLLSLTFDDQGYLHYIVFSGFEKIYGNMPVSLGYTEKLKSFLESTVRK